MNINTSQMKRLHLLLNRVKLMDQKASLVYSFSNGRSESSRELSWSEADQMIRWLEDQDKANDPADRKRKLIIHYARQMGWETESGKADMQRIDEWCRHKGKYKKGLNEHSLEELSKLIWQMEQAYKHFLKSI